MRSEKVSQSLGVAGEKNGYPCSHIQRRHLGKAVDVDRDRRERSHEDRSDSRPPETLPSPFRNHDDPCARFRRMAGLALRVAMLSQAVENPAGIAGELRRHLDFDRIAHAPSDEVLNDLA